MHAPARGLRVAVALAALVASASPSSACCPAWGHGEPVRIADQRILVAWDPATKVEHFVREARFDSAAAGAEDFGFLVPTPSEPEIAEADGAAFDRLGSASEPKIVEVPRVRPHWSLLGEFLLSEKSSYASRAVDAEYPMTRSAVQVVKTVRVAGYEAAVLRADDPQRLGKWLSDNGYQSRPELVEWSRPYVEAGWMITAFKYVGDAERIDVAAVRMSFATDAPLFPYRVPTDQIAPEGRGNRLRAYVVGPGRASGTLGAGDGSRDWSQAAVRYARPLSADGGSSTILAGALPEESALSLADAWLTTFDDDTWPSGTADLFFGFDPAAKPFQRVIERKVDRDVLLPLDVLALAAVGAVIVSRRRAAG